MIHPIADCEHPLLCLPGPGVVSHETAISGYFQQNLASLCNGVSIWRLIMEWILKLAVNHLVVPGVDRPQSLMAAAVITDRAHCPRSQHAFRATGRAGSPWWLHAPDCPTWQQTSKYAV